jgi:hypothetical protein
VWIKTVTTAINLLYMRSSSIYSLVD